jgi:hypothetical protein
MAKIEKKTKRYPSDLTDEEWGADQAIVAEACKERAQTGRRPARGIERDPLHGTLRRRLAHVAERLPTLTDGLLVVPSLRKASAVPHHP